MPLSFDALKAHGFSDRLVHRWAEAYGPSLLPLQAKAVQTTGFLHGGNLIVFASTSSGKTFVAEMAALKHLETRRRVIYLVPTKALAEEKYREFTERYGGMEFDMRVATRERPETDPLVVAGRFDLLIAIYEKMKSYLVVHPELLSQVGLVVMDEIQMLGEPGRGEVVDLILTKMARSPFGAQFIGLSAVLGDSQRIAGWLHSELLIFRERPVELREGVFNRAGRVFHYRCFNSGEMGEETLFPEDGYLGGSDENYGCEAVVSLAVHLAAGRGEQALVFVPTRQMTRAWAGEAARRSGLPPAAEALEELAATEDSHSREMLEGCLRAGVAFHNSDLSPQLRRLVEEHYNRGAIRLLVSTSTLAQGVNLSARNVIQIPHMIATEQWTGSAHVVPLSLQRFKNQGGRAARYGRGYEFGRSILLARGEAEAERLGAEYLRDEFEPLRPPLLTADLEAIVTDLVASRICHTRDELVAFLVNTYSGLTAWSPKTDEFTMKVDEALAAAFEDHFLTRDPRSGLSASGLGSVLAATGVRSQTATRLGEWVRSTGGDLDFPLMEPLVVAAFTPDAREYPVWLSEPERRSANYLQEALEALEQPMGEPNPVLRPLLDPPGGFTPEDLVSLKMAVAMNEWIGPRETRELEERFRMFAGSLAGLGAQFNWLVQTAAALVSVYGLGSDMARRLTNLAERLGVGVEESGVPLARLRVENLSRSAIRALAEAGFDSVEALATADEDALTRVVPQRLARAAAAAARERIKEREKTAARKTSQAVDGQVPVPPAEPLPASISEALSDESDQSDHLGPRLIIDLRGPGLAILDGERLALPPLAHRLLVALARAGSRGVKYGDIMKEVWEGAIVEKQQISMHKTRIVKAMAAIAGDPAAERLIETRKGFGLILKLAPEEIEIRE